MLKKLSEKLGANFPATTPGCSMVKIAVSKTLSQKFFNSKQAQQKVNHCSKKKRKGGKGKEKNKSKIRKAKRRSQNFDFCACPSQNVVKRDAGGQKSKLSCYQWLLDQIKANLANIQLENLQKVVFGQNIQEANWVKHVYDCKGKTLRLILLYSIVKESLPRFSFGILSDTGVKKYNKLCPAELELATSRVRYSTETYSLYWFLQKRCFVRIAGSSKESR